jgi:hypothetical protein
MDPGGELQRHGQGHNSIAIVARHRSGSNESFNRRVSSEAAALRENGLRSISWRNPLEKEAAPPSHGATLSKISRSSVMSLMRSARRFRLPSPSWSLRANMVQAEVVDIPIDIAKLQALCRVDAGGVQDSLKSVISWTRQIQKAEIPAGTPPTISPLDFWGYTMRLTEEEELENEPISDNILNNAPNRESRFYKLPKSASED